MTKGAVIIIKEYSSGVILTQRYLIFRNFIIFRGKFSKYLFLLKITDKLSSLTSEVWERKKGIDSFWKNKFGEIRVSKNWVSEKTPGALSRFKRSTP